MTAIAEEPFQQNEALDLIRIVSQRRRADADYLQLLVVQAVDMGSSWRTIGRALGTSGQAAWEHYRGVARPKPESDDQPGLF